MVAYEEVGANHHALDLGATGVLTLKWRKAHREYSLREALRMTGCIWPSWHSVSQGRYIFHASVQLACQVEIELHSPRLANWISSQIHPRWPTKPRCYWTFESLAALALHFIV